MFKYFDIHSHLNFSEFDDDREEIIDELQKAQIATTTIGTDIETSQSAVFLADKYSHLFATIGIHPGDRRDVGWDEEVFLELVKNPKTVAIGECGLDYFSKNIISKDEEVRQKKLFERHIQFAIDHDKPLMIHCRDAYKDVLEILSSYHSRYGDALRGNMHFFAGDVDIARQCLDVGFSLSFTGVITFTRDYDEVIKFIPSENIMAETDAPYVTPIPHRGKRNSPLYISEIVNQIALIRDEDTQEMEKTLLSNALSFFLH